MNKFWTSASGTNKIDPESLHDFLGERGFKTYNPEGVKTTILVKVENNRLKQVSPEDIRRFCWDYIDSGYEFSDSDERRQIKSEFQRSASLFNKNNLHLLRAIDVKECHDTKEKGYIFFNNCVVDVTGAIPTVKKYDEINGVVFESDICKVDFDAAGCLPKEGNMPIVPSGEFYEFVKDLCQNKNEAVYKKSLESIETIIGYLIHRHKDPGNAKAVILMDTYVDGAPNGGTGKGLLMKGLSYVRDSAHQDGKYFTSGDKFVFSNIKFGTRLLVIDDVPKAFDFEKIFPLITEKTVVERKYENKFIIPFEESPKVVITTNYTVEGTGSSHRRRKLEFILSETYNDEYSPEDKFGHLLFTEWDSQEWSRFYSFMIYCLQQFLKKGIVNPGFNVAIRKLKMEATSQFIEFAQSIEYGVKHNKKKVYDDFYSKYPDHHKIEMTTFRNWLKYIADAFNLKFTETHSGNENFFEFSLE
jgi:hypothetical protein